MSQKFTLQCNVIGLDDQVHFGNWSEMVLGLKSLRFVKNAKRVVEILGLGHSVRGIEAEGLN